MTTREGFYDRKEGFQQGLPCTATITPRTNVPAQTSDIFDVIVIGAGYAGLITCRDLCNSGFKVLLIEARDRIGGRTYTANIDGHLYEMGGTWVHWNQAHVWHTMHRYGMTELSSSAPRDIGCQRFTVSVDGKKTELSRHDEESIMQRGFEELFNIDGQSGRALMPYPHDPHHNPDIKAWEAISAAERIEKIKPILNEVELATLQASIGAISGNTMQNTGFFDLLRWWALSGYSAAGVFEFTETYKIAAGQSSFARIIFEEALATGNLRYTFDTVISTVEDSGTLVKATTLSETKWLAKRLVSTIPLNVLSQVQFNPPLPPKKLAATQKGHINFGAKVHLEAEGSDLRSWSGAAWPSKRVFACHGDGLTNAGKNTHIVCFGSNNEFAHPREDCKEFAAEVKQLMPMQINKVIWHNWLKDPFSRGTWCVFPPSYSFQYLEALRERHGNILFSSADWALGWRGFIDGAIEEGSRAAKQIIDELGFPKRIAGLL
ncbi:monoamine oxidase maoN [Penicillium manginii]|uniref:monoamine oxidase maoN n=1 Tax=Penicillium manginii TaxID=203109 RepID=UPI002549B72C|nr:monoamine oxidase maoN [Penicillium manginii]KAJ5750671.1 monoamine oxidase maoN [Penicillium manginii]